MPDIEATLAELTADVGDPVEEPTNQPGGGGPASADTQPDPHTWESRYKDLQSHTTKVQEENAAMRERLAVIESRLAAPPEPPPGKHWLDESAEELAERLRDDPSTVLGTLKELEARLEGRLVGVLEQRDQAIRSQFDKLNPDVQAQREAIAELRKDPDFAGLPDAVLAKVAARMPKKQQAQPRGGVGGGARPRMTPTEAVDPAEKKFFDQLYGGHYDFEEAKK